ncbi:hypothetical protein [Enterococcus faecium]
MQGTQGGFEEWGTPESVEGISWWQGPEDWKDGKGFRMGALEWQLE